MTGFARGILIQLKKKSNFKKKNSNFEVKKYVEMFLTYVTIYIYITITKQKYYIFDKFRNPN